MNQRLTEYNLNSNELEQLIDKYVTTIVDSMSMEDLVDYVKTDYYNCVDKLTEHDLIEEIKYTLDEEMLDEFVTTIKEQSVWQIAKNMMTF